MEDRFGNELSTASRAARDQYVEGVDGFLTAMPGAEAAFERAVDADANLALANVGIARCRLLMGDRAGAQAAIAAARAAKGLNARETAHVAASGMLADGDVPGGYQAIRAHARDYPRDTMVVQTCTSVFGLIGFSGREGREAEQLAYTSELAPHFGDDPWFLGMHAFANGEVGRLDIARELIDKALAGNPKSAHNAHVNAHIHYEAGEHDAGYRFLKEWWKDYGKGGAIHGHVSWHVALWALDAGDMDFAWKIVDENCKPGGSEGPPLNILTDTISFLHRAHLRGVDVPAARWQEISQYAADYFAAPGLAFADMHVALAHSMAGNKDAVENLIQQAAGPAADIVAPAAAAFRAFADEDWDGVELHLSAAMPAHERFGGSRAQRDLLEFTLAHAMCRQGKQKDADRLLAMRRPRQREFAAA